MLSVQLCSADRSNRCCSLCCVSLSRSSELDWLLSASFDGVQSVVHGLSVTMSSDRSARFNANEPAVPVKLVILDPIRSSGYLLISVRDVVQAYAGRLLWIFRGAELLSYFCGFTIPGELSTGFSNREPY